MSLALARAVADAVLYEGYLLYPYRSTSRKNQVRWQFGVLGPVGAAEAGVGEESEMSAQCLLRAGGQARVRVFVRFLQLQRRGLERVDPDGSTTPVDELTVGGTSWVAWDEAVERELELGPVDVQALRAGWRTPIAVAGGADTEPLRDAAGALAGRLLRRRRALRGELGLRAEQDGSLLRLRTTVHNLVPADGTKDAAIQASLIGAHVLLAVTDAEFVSVIDPPADAVDAAERCAQHRCWPVLAGEQGETDIALLSPIILYDHPAIAPESVGALFDSTEIDEILTLRVLTLTEEEKAAARATDAHAAAILDRVEAMSPADLQRLHGVLRDPHGAATWSPTASAELPPAEFPRPEVPISEFPLPGTPWWDPGVDAAVDPERETVQVGAAVVGKGSLVRLRPSRRADAQDLFFAGRTARVAAVQRDVDGGTHVAVVLDDDPAADLHDWYGRYLHFAPEELEPLADAGPSRTRREEEDP